MKRGEWTAYDDAHSRAVFLKFKEALEPLMATVAPDWLLHHIKMERRVDYDTMGDIVEIRLVIKSIGSARELGGDGDLLTGYKRLSGPT